MLTYSSIPDTFRHRFTSLSRENFGLWLFVAHNGLFDEAEEFINDCTYDKIFTRCLLVDPPNYDFYRPWEDDLPF